MIIVGQLDDMIVNFNLVSDIFIRDRTYIVASCPHIENYALVLGRYETEERTKEVLQEIIDTFIEKEYFHINKSSLNNLDELAEPKYILRPVGSLRVYYMPKE